MKILNIVFCLILAVVMASTSLLAQSYNYEEMEMDEYNALLQEWQGRLEVRTIRRT